MLWLAVNKSPFWLTLLNRWEATFCNLLCKWLCRIKEIYHLWLDFTHLFLAQPIQSSLLLGYWARKQIIAYRWKHTFLVSIFWCPTFPIQIGTDHSCGLEDFKPVEEALIMNQEPVTIFPVSFAGSISGHQWSWSCLPLLPDASVCCFMQSSSSQGGDLTSAEPRTGSMKQAGTQGCDALCWEEIGHKGGIRKCDLILCIDCLEEKRAVDR